MTSSGTPHDDAPGWTPQLWAILLVLGGALCLDGLDVSMVGVALPSIRSALSLSTSSLQWIISGYVLGYGGLLLLGGRAADLLGRRRVFLFAISNTLAFICVWMPRDTPRGGAAFPPRPEGRGLHAATQMKLAAIAGSPA
jgi:MFS family permease